MRYPDYLVHYNKNHDKKTGRFTFGDGNGDGVTPDDYRTPELDKKYSELEKTGIFKLYDNYPWLEPEDNAEEKWGKDVVKAVDIGIKAFGAEKMWGSEDIDKNTLRSWFFLEDQAIGFPEIAYLVVKGWSGDKIFNALRDANKMWDKDNAFRNAYTGYPDNKNWNKLFGEAANKEPYKDIYTLMEVSHYITNESDTIDTYIAECEKLLKEMEHSDMDYSSMDYSEYLMHFNRMHDKKTGRFTFGDGDGDGIRDDHSNQKENNKSKSYSRDRSGETGESNRTSNRNDRSGQVADRSHRDRYTGGGGNRINYNSQDNYHRSGGVGYYGNKRNLPKPERGKYGDLEITTTYLEPNPNPKSKRPAINYSQDKNAYDEDQTRARQTYATKNPNTSANGKVTNRDFNRGGTAKTVRLGDTKVGNIVKGDRERDPRSHKPENRIGVNSGKNNDPNRVIMPRESETSNRNGNSKSLRPALNYSQDKNAYDSDQTRARQTYATKDPNTSANGKVANSRVNSYNVNAGEKAVSTYRDNYVDEQKVTNQEATEIYMMRNMGQTLLSMYEEDEEKKKKKAKKLLEITNTKNWNKK